ncbi:lipid-A-disaccharide synthase N-terminal domain-containing protein [Patescibacteria group bacterium]|nr:lipid-A-disaccharide synthase N-terminal domain-containing protein [Patescibacteria group bacterium]MCG2701763.1 lipid-A-disaccharide synthase N-terminal domain-containing protein [Candidatus Parcubacteria bacterium]MBU4264668.1 lipid-A-disaccharide synthase N-terminal domain-containing protein [Patescibacteria group bacterium]MBU4390623.1 lipid-A-disaccharide synthase N-terminal domain-containing protein [Patescibacteria group bacterium]MBU4396638.1 lipid-A-disaccharide synthase N-terminal 
MNKQFNINAIDWWIIFGFCAQFVFFLRFVVQWWASEKAKKTVIPKLFWYLSMMGTLMILIYSIKRKDIVFIVASCLNILLYLRNLIIAKKHKN